MRGTGAQVGRPRGYQQSVCRDKGDQSLHIALGVFRVLRRQLNLRRFLSELDRDIVMRSIVNPCVKMLVGINGCLVGEMFAYSNLFL